MGGGWIGAVAFGAACAAAFSIAADYIEPPATTPEPTAADDDTEADDDTDTSTGAFCTGWTSFGFFNSKGHEIGEVVLHENDGGNTSYQGTQEWAAERCQAALAALD
ncbi:hypothetical protein [Candidatus Poriferisodalis sp.]|uniref:hypothetical protein n=1 Tax=Candidatus Poriferisodalis sp. TaxID=3101277 RepID=UPI003B02EC30